MASVKYRYGIWPGGTQVWEWANKSTRLVYLLEGIKALLKPNKCFLHRDLFAPLDGAEVVATSISVDLRVVEKHS